MAYDDLRDWIKALEKHGELRCIREEVSPELEITEITDRVSKIGARAKSGATKDTYAPGGPALLFENVKDIRATRSSLISSAANGGWLSRWAFRRLMRSLNAFTA